MIGWFIRPKVAASAVLLVFVLLLLAFAVGLSAVPRGGRGLNLLLMTFLPVPFYLWAIWEARRAIRSIGWRGANYADIAAMLIRVGAALFTGGIVRVLLVPLGIRLWTGAGSFAVFDPAAITVGAVGVTLMIIARLVAEAAAMRAELDEII